MFIMCYNRIVLTLRDTHRATLHDFWGISKVVNVLKANKRQKLRPFLVEAFLITGGTWQIRTAVHGFADR